jgi:hypothetical protein
MAEQSPTAAFHFLEVPTHPLNTDSVLRHLQEVEWSNTSHKTIDAYMRKMPSSASQAMEEQGPTAAFHLLDVPTHTLGPRGC